MIMSASPSIRANCWRASRPCCRKRGPSALTKDAPVAFGPFVFDPATRQLSREQVVVKLTGGEINLLEALVRNAGKPLSRERCWRWRATTTAASATTGPSTSPSCGCVA